MASCLIILIHVRSELNFDRFHSSPEEIYRVAIHASVQDQESNYPMIGYLWGDLLVKDVPEATAMTRMFGGQALIVKQKPKQFEEDRFYFADSSFQDVFNLTFVQGNPEEALKKPNSLIVTEETAQKYFGDADPLGQVLTVEIGPGEVDITVTGVIEAFPYQSHFHPDFIASMLTLHKAFGGPDIPFFKSPVFTAFYTYIRTNDPEGVYRQLNQLYITQVPEQGKEFVKGLFLQPLTDIHLTSRLIGELEQNGNSLFVYIFLFVAVLTLLIACINYVNLTTALAGNRSKEVGMRKVVGADRMELIRQFMTESVVIALISMGLAWVFAELMKEVLTSITDLTIRFNYGSDPFFWLVLLGITVFAGIIAGSYPALVLSRFEPLQVLRGRLKMGVKGSMFRKVLVVFQFGVSTALMIGTGILFKQLSYIQNMDMGFNKDLKVVIPIQLDGTPQEQIQTVERVKQAFIQYPGIINATATGSLPGQPRGIGRVHVQGQPQDQIHQPVTLPVDFNYVETMGLEILTGRQLAQSYGMDSTQSLLINESAIREMDLMPGNATLEDVLSVRMTFLQGQIGQNGQEQTAQVVGVFKDMHFEPIHREIHPMLLRIQPQNWQNIIVHIKPDDQEKTLQFMTKTWNRFAPEREFNYEFLDQELADIYKSDQEMGSLISFFTILAILIACLGLFGLSAFTTQQRRKEISIRKVLGAETSNIVGLLTKEFLLLVLIAFPFAAMLAWWATKFWLESFAYHADIGIGVYLMAGLLSVLIAFFTVGYLSYRAALANPADSLYRE